MSVSRKAEVKLTPACNGITSASLEVSMHDYDVFELYPDHSLRLRLSVHGTQVALATLEALASRTINECFATDISTQEIIGRVNEGRAVARILYEDGFCTN